MMSIQRVSTVPRAVRLGFGTAAVALLASACSSGSGAHNAAGNGAPSSGQGVTVKAHGSGSGAFLTDASGRTLYMFGSDTAAKSSCSTACLASWPALVAHGAVKAGSGVSAKAITTIKFAGGTHQVSYHGHPLYYYAGDSAPGQTTGEGSRQFGAPWWLVTPSGRALKSAPAARPSSKSSSQSGGTSGWG